MLSVPNFVDSMILFLFSPQFDIINPYLVIRSIPIDCDDL